MPDVTFLVSDIPDADAADRLERAISRVAGVNLVNVDPEKGLVAVSYDGGEAGVEDVEGAIRDAGHEVEPSPGADPSVD